VSSGTKNHTTGSYRRDSLSANETIALPRAGHGFRSAGHPRNACDTALWAHRPAPITPSGGVANSFGGDLRDFGLRDAAPREFGDRLIKTRVERKTCAAGPCCASLAKEPGMSFRALRNDQVWFWRVQSARNAPSGETASKHRRISLEGCLVSRPKHRADCESGRVTIKRWPPDRARKLDFRFEKRRKPHGHPRAKRLPR